MANFVALYKEILEKQKQEDAALRANYPTLQDLWAEVVKKQESYNEAKEKYEAAEKLIKEHK